MSDTLRELLASFVIEVDKAGELAKGNAQIDAMKKRLEELQAAAKPAAKAVSDVFAKAAQTAARNVQAIAASQLGGGAGGGGGFAAAGANARAAADAARTKLQGALGLSGRANDDGFSALSGLNAKAGGQLGPTRDTFNQSKQATYQAEQAAAQYAQTLRGKLASAVDKVRAGFNGGSGKPTEGGPGLLDRLFTIKNAMLAAGAGTVIHGVKRLVDGIGDIRESAQRLGVTTDQFQRLNVLAEQNGTSVEALGTAFRTLANAAVQPTKATTAAFTKLKLSAKDTHGEFKSTNDLFFEVAGALAGVSNEAERSALAQDLLGRGAQQLKPLFASGTKEIDKQRKALASMNVLSEDTIIQADDLSDSWRTVGPSLLAAAEPLIKILLPALTKLTGWIMDGVGWLGKWLKQTDLTAIGLTALAAVLSMKVVPALSLLVGQARLMMTLGGGATQSLLGMAGAGAKVALSFARAVLPLLFLEDFFGFLNGADSATGRLIEMLFGKEGLEATLKAIATVKAAIVDIVNYITGNPLQGGLAKALGVDETDVKKREEARRVQATGGPIAAPLKLVNQPFLRMIAGLVGVEDAVRKNRRDAGIDPDTEQLSSGRGNKDSIPAPWAVDGAAVRPRAQTITVGDIHNQVTVTMGPSATAPDVGRAVGSAMTDAADQTSKLVATYGGFDGG